MYLFGRENLALRGHPDSITDQKFSDNLGNVIVFLRETANYSPELAERITNTVMKNATYLSPQSQNELVDMVDVSTIQKDFINDIVTISIMIIFYNVG